MASAIHYAAYRFGFLLRESGQALERLGAQLQGSYAIQEQLSRHRTIMNLFDKAPQLGRDVFVAPNASVIGDVTLGDKASVFYGSVLRGDRASIVIGSKTNIQDGVTIRTAAESVGEHELATVIGDGVTVGHSVSMYGATIGNGALIGMGATLQHGVNVEAGSLVAAGAVVEAGTTVPSGEVWGGSPARFLRKLKPEEARFFSESADNYVNVAYAHAKENAPSVLDVAKAKGLI